MPLHNEILLLAPAAIAVRPDRQRSAVKVDEHFLTSIRQRGLISPILVETDSVGRYWLVAGERRLTAARQLGLTAVPCRTCSDVSPIDLELFEFEENAKREDLEWQDFVKSVARVHALHVELDPDWTMGESAAACAMATGNMSLCIKVAKHLGDERVAACSSIREAYNVIKRREDRAAASDLEELLTPVPLRIVPKPVPQIDLATVADNEISDNRVITSDADATAEVERMFMTNDTASVDPTLREVVRLVEKQPVRDNFLPVPQPAPSPESIQHANFVDWLATYDGPKFNLLHCDFPYGIGVFDGKQGIGAEGSAGYSDTKDDYFTLLRTMLQGLNRVLSLSAHVIFWYSETHGPATRKLFAELAPSLNLFKFPLVWVKSDNAGISSDARRTPRHVYETALVAVRGDRRIVRVAADAYASPSDRKLHPSAKPEPMLRHFLGMFVDETTNLLDPTCGSGSALRAAESLGAKSVLGLERDEQWVGPARQALTNARLLRGTGK